MTWATLIWVTVGSVASMVCMVAISVYLMYRNMAITTIDVLIDLLEKARNTKMILPGEEYPELVAPIDLEIERLEEKIRNHWGRKFYEKKRGKISTLSVPEENPNKPIIE